MESFTLLRTREHDKSAFVSRITKDGLLEVIIGGNRVIMSNREALAFAMYINRNVKK